MKKLLLASPLAAALCLAIWLTQSGCTILGFAVGASQDNRQPKQEMTVQGMEIYAIKAQTRITVYRKNLEPLTGYFKEAVRMNPKTDTAVNGILLQQKSVDHRIPLDQIDHVYVPGRKATGKIIGAVVGLAIDAGLYVLALSNLELDLFSGFGGLCPYVYSFDGARYQLDAELCSGAFYPAAQRSDWGALPHLRAVNGAYKIKLANELNETDYIDHLRLLVFEHAPGARICPSAGSAFIEVAQPRGPRTARTAEGLEVSGLLRAADEDCWLSNPLGRDAECDQVELTFDKPAHAAGAALLLRLRNTDWVAAQYRALLALHGRALPQWYDQLQSDAATRTEWESMLHRECDLQIQVWDGAAWQPAGSIRPVGPAVERELALEVDLSAMAGEVLRIRLDVPPGYWLVNTVQADFSYARATPAHTLLPENATTPNGTNNTAALRQADGAFLAMPARGDCTEIVFRAPVPRPNLDRTVLVHGSGYYTLNTTAAGEPQAALLDRLLHEPGAYNRWRLQTLNQQVKALNAPGLLR